MLAADDAAAMPMIGAHAKHALLRRQKMSRHHEFISDASAALRGASCRMLPAAPARARALRHVKDAFRRLCRRCCYRADPCLCQRQRL